MHFSTVFGLAASIASASAVSQGFNYGATFSDGVTFKAQSDYKADFTRQRSLQGTSGFTSARLYTMIQGGTTDTPTSAIQAAIDTKTTLLLGLWASAGSDVFNNEVNALKSAIQQYGTDFTSLIVGISVGSEDLYRVSPTGIENDSGLGSSPDELVGYIKQVRSAIKDTSASSASIGHVDTWTAWANGSNSAVVDNCDWLGMDTYPYFQTTVENSIENANQTFWDAYDATVSAAKGKDVWVTETGWPVSGKTANLAVPSIKNAEQYWQDVACALLGNYNTWWFTLQDSAPTTPDPSFGIVGSDLNSDPLYDLSCKQHNSSSTSSGSSSATGTATVSSSASGSNHGSGSGSAYATGTAAPSGGAIGANGTASGGSGAAPTGSAATGTPTAPSATSAAPAASQTGNSASKSSSAMAAGIFAIFGLVAAL